MTQISIKNDHIFYYGNPAGYIDKEKAVIDHIFQCDELKAWCQSRNLMPQWTGGIMEKLMTGIESGVTSDVTTPLKNVRIWQLRPDVDIYKKFISLEECINNFGKPLMEDYCIAYDGQLGTNDMEAIYVKCNTSRPPGYSGHSLSMSDVVELYDQSSSQFYYCDRYGFRQIEFSGDDQTQNMSETISQSF